MRVSTYTLAGHRHRTIRQGICVWHRTINMQADTDPRPRPTTGRINMQVTRTDTAKPSQIAPGRALASSPIVGHQKRLQDARRGAQSSRNRFADNVSIYPLHKC